MNRSDPGAKMLAVDEETGSGVRLLGPVIYHP